MYLIVGLGNPGPKYRFTRHNIGFRVVNLWAKLLGVQLSGRRFNSRSARIKYQEKDIIFVRPVTYMNRSGRAVKEFIDFFHIDKQNMIVIHDDLDLPVGKIKMVRKGGAGGHRGVISTIEYLGSNHFPRLKIGIGRPCFEESIEDFVLSPFYQHEMSTMERVTQKAIRACRLFLSEGVERAMNQVNSLD